MLQRRALRRWRARGASEKKARLGAAPSEGSIQDTLARKVTWAWLRRITELRAYEQVHNLPGATQGELGLTLSLGGELLKKETKTSNFDRYRPGERTFTVSA